MRDHNEVFESVRQRAAQQPAEPAKKSFSPRRIGIAATACAAAVALGVAWGAGWLQSSVPPVSGQKTPVSSAPEKGNSASGPDEQSGHNDRGAADGVQKYISVTGQAIYYMAQDPAFDLKENVPDPNERWRLYSLPGSLPDTPTQTPTDDPGPTSTTGIFLSAALEAVRQMEEDEEALFAVRVWIDLFSATAIQSITDENGKTLADYSAAQDALAEALEPFKQLENDALEKQNLWAEKMYALERQVEQTARFRDRLFAEWYAVTEDGHCLFKDLSEAEQVEFGRAWEEACLAASYEGYSCAALREEIQKAEAELEQLYAEWDGQLHELKTLYARQNLLENKVRRILTQDFYELNELTPTEDGDVLLTAARIAALQPLPDTTVLLFFSPMEQVMIEDGIYTEVHDGELTVTQIMKQALRLAVEEETADRMLEAGLVNCEWDIENGIYVVKFEAEGFRYKIGVTPTGETPEEFYSKAPLTK